MEYSQAAELNFEPKGVLSPNILNQPNFFGSLAVNSKNSNEDDFSVRTTRARSNPDETLYPANDPGSPNDLGLLNS